MVNTLYAAVLTENLFHDNSNNCIFMESDSEYYGDCHYVLKMY